MMLYKRKKDDKFFGGSTVITDFTAILICILSQWLNIRMNDYVLMTRLQYTYKLLHIIDHVLKTLLPHSAIGCAY